MSRPLRLTAMLVAQRLGLHGIGIDMNPEDLEGTRQRLEAEAPLLAAVQHGGR